MRQEMPIPAGVATRAVWLGRGVLAAAPALLTQLGHHPGTRLLLVQDPRTHAAAGRALAGLLSAEGFAVQSLVLEDNAPGHVSGDQRQAEQVTAAAHAAQVVLGVGAGVINDLGKLAARQAQRGYLAVATAASMNGYGSPIAAILEHGVKRTLPAAVTEAILADLDVLAAAPVDLTRSGFADLLSKSSATADWKLAALVRGESYDDRPHRLLEPLVQACGRSAAAIGRGEPLAVGLLVQGLIAGGFAMTLAGRSSPASGGEHLLSHYWDMQAHQRPGHAHALHGYQVAIGTRLCSALYQRLLTMDAASIDVDRLAARWRSWDERLPGLRAAHGELFAVIESEARAQQLTAGQYREELQRVKQVWPELVTQVGELIMPLSRLQAWHAAAQVPATAASVGQTRAGVRHALLHAADVRARYTVLDLAGQLNVLEPWADGLIEEAQVG